MSDAVTIARPYAKAVFKLALSSQTMPEWSDILYQLSFVASNKDARNFISNPESTHQQQVDLILSVCLTPQALLAWKKLKT